jgi:hypothetical protein
MELADLYGAKLIEICKRHQKVELTFERASRIFKLSFEGLLLETEITPMDYKVIKARKSEVLGIKAFDLVSYNNFQDKHLFVQLFIEFDASSFKKSELYCICKKYHLENAVGLHPSDYKK